MAKKILIVEDERIIAEDLSEVLTSSGYDVVGISATGKEAMDILHTHKPELVSMDIRIQGDMDGIETARKIKNIVNIPIIFMTSYSDSPTIERAKAVSPLLIVKPFNKRELLEMAATALADKAAPQE